MPKPRRTSFAVALSVTTAGLVVAPGLLSAAAAAPPTEPYISELHYDDVGADADEFVEVHLPAGTSSEGLSVVLYNGSNGTSYATLDLPDVTAPGDGPAVVAVDGPGTGIQNGAPDGLALVDGTTVLEFLSYEGAFDATDGPANGTTSTDIGVAEAGEPEGQSLSRSYDPEADALRWWGPDTATRDAVNPPPPPVEGPAEVCDVPVTHEIGEVQGDSFSTPVAGTEVTVEGVVVGDLPSFGGFFLQDPDGDGNEATSDGVFVASTVEVDLGDTVAVRGTAGESFGLTQIDAGNGAEVCAEGDVTSLPAPAPLDLPATADEREPLEGMLVAPVDTLTVSEVYDLTSFGELTLSEGGLLVQPTELARPGEGAEAVAAENTLRRIVLDDGLDDRVSVTTRPYLSPETPVRVGDELTFTEPLVLSYGYGQWRLQPADGTAEGVFEPQNTRPEAPEEVGGDIQVAAFNVLNYFLTFGGEGRGARDAEQLELQADKIVPAIEALDAEVVTLMEIEDTDSTGYSPGDADQAVADLVSRLNDAAGFEKWAYVPLPEELYGVDRDVIRNAIIYQPAEVETVGDPVGDVDESVWFNAREPIAQTFVADGDEFTVVANHFKSKSPGDDPPTEGDNADAGDWQGAWNGDRVRQAEALVDFAEELVAATGDEDVLLMGDFNAYSQEDPIEVFRAADYVNLGEELDPGRYSYVFDDMSGSLDHALASEELAAKVTDVAHWNINAVESFAYQYYGDPALYGAHPYRSSDHDPLVLGIDLEAPPAEQPTCDGQVATIVGTDGADVLRGTHGADVIVGLGGDDTIIGAKGPDVICGGAGDDKIKGNKGNDRLFGNQGDDMVHGNHGHDLLVGGKGADRLHGGQGKDDVRQ